ncbi:26S proteasome subunit RPN7-domain-containing protein [Sphaerosporella brunnea]|uniref:26S proteasome subunit RPN7-domain-containing protein n=1 Tax=Sphaerosporella brunnea TaxID=1250544 RepID=A0A5J5EWA2_9PEZI|nr:26S proteasome subunit RPN7-domain-containing protein [Sphaerosporella brunnea]
MGSDPQYASYPNLLLSQHIFTLRQPNLSAAYATAQKILTASIKEHSQAPLYRYLAHPTEGVLANKIPWDENLYNELKAKNDEELKGYEDELKEAEEKAGESEIVAAMGKKAEFWARVVDKEKALQAYEELFAKTASTGAKIDIVLAMIRIQMFFDDKHGVSKNIDRAQRLVESGGDWDRRNRLKSYNGLHLLSIRHFSDAAPLLLESLSTFTSYEVCTYTALVLYAVLAGTISLDRVDFKKKVVDSAEVLAVLGSKGGPIPGEDVDMVDASSNTEGFESLEMLINSFYTCDYKSFFISLAEVEDRFLTKDRLLAEHKAWFVREMRRHAYSQLLESYRVVSLQNMADQFGVSVEWLDRDLSKFIPSKQLNCTIDRVNGTIETNRPDDKNRQYNEVVKQGDQLLTKLQKFGQAVRLRGSERA